MQHSIPPPAFKFSPTPEVSTYKSDATKPTNQISPSWSCDTFATPPQAPSESSPTVGTTETKPHPSKLPLKSALRRSERLRKTSLATTSQRKVGISNLVHVSLLHTYRYIYIVLYLFSLMQSMAGTYVHVGLADPAGCDVGMLMLVNPCMHLHRLAAPSSICAYHASDRC